MITNKRLAKDTQKRVVSTFLLLIIVIICASCGCSNMDSLKSPLLEYEDIEDVILTIYYTTPDSTVFGLSIDYLIDLGDEEDDEDENEEKVVHKYVINGSRLKENIGLLDRINTITLTPLDYDYHMHIRVYYVFETEEGDKLLDVAMWGGRDDILEEDIILGENDKVLNLEALEDLYYIYVNGVAVKANDAFYDMIMPFLPDYLAEEFNAFIEEELKNPWWK